ncbi:complement C1q domain-containing protein [bacterium]|nr:complement C1q domain-containing protein [bacterium]
MPPRFSALEQTNGRTYRYFSNLPIDSDEIVTLPKQPAFSAVMSADQLNIPINATTTVQFDTEKFDRKADFNTGTFAFTAPVTGIYLLGTIVGVTAIDISSVLSYSVQIVAGMDVYEVQSVNPSQIFAADSAMHFNGSILVSLAAEQTAKVQLEISNSGASQADILATSSGAIKSTFWGYLVA